MSGPQPAPADDDPDGPGILGNLPRTRPSVRSPRRAEAAAKSARAQSAAAAEPGEEPKASDGRSREQELEELARAGLSLAGGAATLGLRVAGRAAAALRGAVERQ